MSRAEAYEEWWTSVRARGLVRFLVLHGLLPGLAAGFICCGPLLIPWLEQGIGLAAAIREARGVLLTSLLLGPALGLIVMGALWWLRFPRSGRDGDMAA